jgi:hypothetical protein
MRVYGLKKLLFRDRTEVSAFVTISYHLMRIGNPSGFVLSEHSKDVREKITKWLI